MPLAPVKVVSISAQDVYMYLIDDATRVGVEDTCQHASAKEHLEVIFIVYKFL